MSLPSVPSDIIARDKGLGPWNIIHAYRGSLAHGTFVPSSDPNSIDDIDTMAVCVPDESYYLGLRQYGSRGTREIKEGEWDIVIYEAQKAIRLLAQGNPNILALLWVPEHHYINVTPAGRLLIDNRDIFVGKHVYNSFVGYARAQLAKMERTDHQGYMGDKRKRLVEKHGYDTKNASHLIRLLRQGVEFLHTGELRVFRDDADVLVDIKNGRWPKQAILKEADKLFDRAELAFKVSPLPERPSARAYNKLCVDVVSQAWIDQGWRYIIENNLLPHATRTNSNQEGEWNQQSGHGANQSASPGS